MVQGCYNGWFFLLVQLALIYSYFEDIFTFKVFLPETTDKIYYLKDWSFALVTLLEFLYPCVAFCEASPYQMKDMFSLYFEFLANSSD